MSDKENKAIYLNRRISRHARGHRLLRAMIFFICAMAIAAATVIGCGWDGSFTDSVRFSSRTPREFGRLPPLPSEIDSAAANEVRAPSESFIYDDTYYARAEQRRADTDSLWNIATAAEERGELNDLRVSLNEFLARTNIARDMSLRISTHDSVASQANRNSARDRLDALTALDAGSPAARVRAYLAARRMYDAGLSADEIRRALADISPDANLRDNVAYLTAALLYREDRKREAAREWNRLVARYPRSEKREAALFMAAVATMKQSCGFRQTSGDPEHLRTQSATYQSGRRIDPSPDPYEPCRDEHWATARDAFTRLIAQYPRGRFRNDARGWLAYLYLRGGDRASALVEYYRLLSDATDTNARLEAVFSLRLSRPYASEDEMRRVEAELEDEPQPALAYCYHNLYNFAASADYGVLYEYPRYSFEEEARQDARQRERVRIAQFAARLVRRFPQTRFGAAFAVRAAEANAEAGDYAAARSFAVRALSAANASDDVRHEALWIKGFSEHRLNNQAAARRTLENLVAEDARGRFTEGARRLLAMAAEDAGDREAALEQYIALDYAADIAYFVDVLMSPDELARFIERRPNLQRRDEFLYSLGVRYMRADRFAEARAVYARVRTGREEEHRYYYNEHDPCLTVRCSPKNPMLDSHSAGVRARWTLHDLELMHDIERLRRTHDEATDDETRAEALYQLASYIYESSTLLFYNPAMWGGAGRYRSLSDLHALDNYRAPNEAERLWQHAQEHETLARAAVLFQEVARRYPQTHAARDALYTAAVCDERLSDFNPYWRDVYRVGLHAGERRVTYAHLRATYPRYQLPRGTYAWQPSTRTVNGGPGWSSPPPRPPRLTRMARAQNYIAAAFARAVVFWHERGRGGLITSLLIIYLPIVLLIATQTRAFLRREMKRGEYRPSCWWRDVWRKLSTRGRTPRERHDAACAAVLDALTRFGRFAIFDRRGRGAIILNAAAHAVLLWLALALWRALFSS